MARRRSGGVDPDINVAIKLLRYLLDGNICEINDLRYCIRKRQEGAVDVRVLDISEMTLSGFIILAKNLEGPEKVRVMNHVPKKDKYLN